MPFSGVQTKESLSLMPGEKKGKKVHCVRELSRAETGGVQVLKSRRFEASLSIPSWCWSVVVAFRQICRPFTTQTGVISTPIINKQTKQTPPNWFHGTHLDQHAR